MTGIYIIRNTENGRAYIGQSVNIKHRLARHLSELRSGVHCNRHLQRAFAKYGETAFEQGTLQKCSPEELTEKEQKWIDIFKEGDLVYNIQMEAGGSPAGLPVSLDTRRRISITLTGQKHSPERCARISAALTGKKRGPRPPFSPEWRANISKAHRGKVLSPEHKAKIVASLIGNTYTKGHVHTEEHKNKIGAALKGKKKSAISNAKASVALMGHSVSPETRAKISKAGKGRHHTEEAKAKISAAVKLRYEAGLIGRQANGNFGQAGIIA